MKKIDSILLSRYIELNQVFRSHYASLAELYLEGAYDNDEEEQLKSNMRYGLKWLDEILKKEGELIEQLELMFKPYPYSEEDIYEEDIYSEEDM